MPKRHFKLKAGSHAVGHGPDARFFSASDPKNCVIESEQNLARLDPLRFELHDGTIPKGGGRVGGPEGEDDSDMEQDQPPGPPGELEISEAANFKAESLGLKKRAEDPKAARQRKEQQLKATVEEDDEEEEGEDEEEEEDESAPSPPRQPLPQAQQTTAQKEEERQAQMRAQQADQQRRRELDARLEQMTVDQLRKTADDEEIELPRQNMPKQELINHMRQQLRRG
jgi:hypothetical protein